MVWPRALLQGYFFGNLVFPIFLAFQIKLSLKIGPFLKSLQGSPISYFVKNGDFRHFGSPKIADCSQFVKVATIAIYAKLVQIRGQLSNLKKSANTQVTYA